MRRSVSSNVDLPLRPPPWAKEQHPFGRDPAWDLIVLGGRPVRALQGRERGLSAEVGWRACGPDLNPAGGPVGRSRVGPCRVTPGSVTATDHLSVVLHRSYASVAQTAAIGPSRSTEPAVVDQSRRHAVAAPVGTVTLVRPCADLLVESLTAGCRERAIAVVMSGTGSCSMDVQTVKSVGGTMIAQDERTSEFFGMPPAAISAGPVGFVLPLGEVALALVALVTAGAGS